jgi:hypothetical protein
MNEDKQFDIKFEKQEETARDSKHEILLRSDYEYAIDSLDLHQTLHDALSKLHEYGWYPTFDELLDYLKEP